MGTKIGTDDFSPSKIFETIFEDNIDGSLYWGMLTQFIFNVRAELLLLLFEVKPSVSLQNMQVFPLLFVILYHPVCSPLTFCSYSLISFSPDIFRLNFTVNIICVCAHFLCFFPSCYHSFYFCLQFCCSPAFIFVK